jgi:hypothetical protein
LLNFLVSSEGDGFQKGKHIVAMLFAKGSDNLALNIDSGHRQEAFMDYHHLFIWPCKVLPPLPKKIAMKISEHQVFTPSFL